MKKVRQKIKIIWKLLDRRKKIILCNTPIHQNIGDQAIAVAEKKFVIENFKDFQFVEIEEEICQSSYLPYMMKLVTKKDIILLQGGGFMGDLWPRHETTMKYVIKQCPNTIKIILPQTCYFTDKSHDRIVAYSKEYKETKKLYLFAREKKSYEFFYKYILPKSKCFLAPDVVLSLNYNSSVKRNGVLLCIREDKESLITKGQKDLIAKYVKQIDKNIKYISTINSSPISVNERENKLNSFLAEFQKSELVITDRLHGMIFAAITGTPCIALDNLSHKVSGVAECIANCDYIKCINVEELNINLVQNVLNSSVSTAPVELLKNQFKQMVMIIKKIYEGKDDGTY